MLQVPLPIKSSIVNTVPRSLSQQVIGAPRCRLRSSSACKFEGDDTRAAVRDYYSAAAGSLKEKAISQRHTMRWFHCGSLVDIRSLKLFAQQRKRRQKYCFSFDGIRQRHYGVICSGHCFLFYSLFAQEHQHHHRVYKTSAPRRFFTLCVAFTSSPRVILLPMTVQSFSSIRTCTNRSCRITPNPISLIVLCWSIRFA